MCSDSRLNREEHFLIGKSKQEAIEILEGLNSSYRIMEEDNKSYAGTCDLRPDRLNLFISYGIVQNVSYG